MPFTPEFNDVYLLGIREVAERLGFIVERADEIEHNGYIVDVIKDRLRSCDVLIAETSTPNPNIYYEIGFAHALDTPTILISRRAQNLPFDVRSVNHVLYDSIVDLREQLARRMKAMLTNQAGPQPTGT